MSARALARAFLFEASVRDSASAWMLLCTGFEMARKCGLRSFSFGIDCEHSQFRGFKEKMRLGISVRFSGVAAWLIVSSLWSEAQNKPDVASQVKVTFYSSGSFLKATMPGYKHGMFSGRIMDEHGQLAMLLPGNFVTFNYDPGPHTFSTNSWAISSPQGGGHVKIDLVAGQHYYLGTYLRSLALWNEFRIEQRTCQQAQEDNKNTVPLEKKHLKDYGLPKAADETSFPACL
jgi:hypothetical protein